MTLEAGTRLGRYEIRSRLGAGGMGEVYLAEDSRLSRKVALKILPADFDAEKLRRFEQEACAASALNHPNILTVYEINQEDSTHYIATEFIDGVTLRERMRSSPMSLSEALDVAAQIASALAAAHEAGIVHRDIKPENVMLRADGYAKVLDFGLAKLTEKRSEPPDPEAETRALVKTSPGLVVGTISYMSPEQARGAPVDARTDIWSLGVVLYEMLTGRLPFEGETASDRLASILKTEAAPPSNLTPEIPAELERIVLKALRKERGERYQTAKDLAVDLRQLKRRLEVEAELERKARPNQAADAQNKTADAPTKIINAATADTPHAASSAEHIASSIQKHKLGFAVGLAILLLAAAGIGRWSSGSRPTNIESIAVLPFVNESGNADNEYLSDGMTESLISSLSQLPNLSVKARSSVFRYKGKEIDPNKIGRELSVQAVLTGGVAQRGNDLSLFIELVDTNTEKVLWSENYNRPLTNLVALQNEIARDVSRKLRARLSGADERHLKNSQTENAEAYQLYLLGRYHLNKLTDDGFRKGRDYFQQASDKDAGYALAYAGLADAYARLGIYNAISPDEGFPKARTAATVALGLDEQTADAHITLGIVKWHYDWDWPGAEKELKRAIEINPSNADARQTYGYYLSAMRRFDEALAEMKRAQELDPLSLERIVATGDVLYQQRRFDQAAGQYQKALEMDPNSGIAHWAIGNVYVQKGMYDEAISEYQKAIPLSGDSPDEPASLAYAYALSGRRQEALQIVDDLKQRSKRRYISPTVIAFIYAGLGENDEAFEWLDKAYNGRDIILVSLKVEPMFDRLRPDARFADLLRRVGLPQ